MENIPLQCSCITGWFCCLKSLLSAACRIGFIRGFDRMRDLKGEGEMDGFNLCVSDIVSACLCLFLFCFFTSNV